MRLRLLREARRRRAQAEQAPAPAEPEVEPPPAPEPQPEPLLSTSSPASAHPEAIVVNQFPSSRRGLRRPRPLLSAAAHRLLDSLVATHADQPFPVRQELPPLAELRRRDYVADCDFGSQAPQHYRVTPVGLKFQREGSDA